MVKVRKIKFQGRDYILTDPDATNSPIATIEQYQNGHTSYAHLYEDGTINRFGTPIGTKADIEFGEFIEIEFDGLTFMTGMVSEEGVLTAAIEKIEK